MAITGLSRPWRAPGTSLAAAALCAATPCYARSAAIDIPAGTLDRALLALSSQSGVDIVSTEGGLKSRFVMRLRGRMTVSEALRRLLDGSGYHAQAMAAGYRIVAGSDARPAPRPPAPKPPRPPAPAAPADDVVVTASKQHVGLRRYPGSLMIIDANALHGLTGQPGDSDAIARALPVVEATQLGPGRNKLFVRGIADSSFNGATQSTASVYFGDVQLSYSGADPDIKLVDVSRLEILEGPQGTLYGAGSIGGIVRITPNPVDLTKVGGAIGLGGVATLHGTPGYDASAVLNLPIVKNVAGVRLVGYRMRDGGYIDDTKRGLTDINSTDTSGVRAEGRFDAGGGWSVEGGVLWQSIDTPDTQYAAVTGNRLTRASTIAQPFASEMLLGRVIVNKTWGSGLELSLATGLATYDLVEDFDATLPGGPPQRYDNQVGNWLLTHEARLSRSTANGSSWVLGLALLYDKNEQNRQVGPLDGSGEIVGVTNVAKSASAFGEITLPIGHRLRATMGLRGTIGRNEATPTFRTRSPFFPGRQTMRVDPTIAVNYRLSDNLSTYARFQTGYRTGGLAVSRLAGRTAEFNRDEIVMGELGFRLGTPGAGRIALGGAVAYAHWKNIQADLFDRQGRPFTINLGDARLLSVEGNVDWQPVRGLRAQLSALYTANEVSGPLADTSVRNNRRLAQVPSIAGSGSLSYAWAAGPGNGFEIASSVDFVGRAVLGTGDYLDVSHPAYAIVGAHVRWTRGPFVTTLAADNLLDSRADRFPFGNPFALGQRTQITPLRPLTVRLGTSFGF
ncbi:TonB-dependent receptor [Sphingomonas immobilis]|uniref:TonB-dependent receptor n=1 Tax=Sphingomonas immobilis TaxID=3063997 RepID=A0ABT9A1V5_9SPHN|nr:TonB-dependent receptor [Sphingomonas sp. CA1-15]MDO7843804.1 TonB-dependent receptor [Sphingomonas sp. CA1-15]